MTSNLKCPFCQQELGRKNINDRMCSNEKCVSWKGNFYGSEDLWRALIQAKQDLEITRNALKELRGDRCLPAQTPWEIIAEKALEQIDHKE